MWNDEKVMAVVRRNGSVVDVCLAGHDHKGRYVGNLLFSQEPHHGRARDDSF
jgi:hypothetical protein